MQAHLSCAPGICSSRKMFVRANSMANLPGSIVLPEGLACYKATKAVDCQHLEFGLTGIGLESLTLL